MADNDRGSIDEPEEGDRHEAYYCRQYMHRRELSDWWSGLRSAFAVKTGRAAALLLAPPLLIAPSGFTAPGFTAPGIAAPGSATSGVSASEGLLPASTALPPASTALPPASTTLLPPSATLPPPSAVLLPAAGGGFIAIPAIHAGSTLSAGPVPPLLRDPPDSGG
ncbi:MAG: hypothetical protein AB7G13_13160 [Lautropia sp.]